MSDCRADRNLPVDTRKSVFSAQAGVRYATQNPFSYVHANLDGHVSILEAVKVQDPMPVRNALLSDATHECAAWLCIDAPQKAMPCPASRCLAGGQHDWTAQTASHDPTDSLTV